MCAIADMRRVVNNSATGPPVRSKFLPGRRIVDAHQVRWYHRRPSNYFWYRTLNGFILTSGATDERPKFFQWNSNASDTLRHKDEKWFEPNPLIVLSSATICHAATPSPLWVHPTHRLQSINRRLRFIFFPSNSVFFVEKKRNSAVNRRVKWSLDDVFVHWRTEILPLNGRWPSRMAIIPFLLQIYSNKLQEKSNFLWKNSKKSGKMA